jgi:cyanate permease
LAGFLFDTTGSYTVMWILTIAMGIVAGILNYPIDDRQIERSPAAATT